MEGLIITKHLSEYDARSIRREAQRDEYVKVDRGVYLDTKTFATYSPWDQHRLMALALGANRTRVLGGVSAAMLHGMWVDNREVGQPEYYPQRPRNRSELGIALAGRLPKLSRVNGSYVTITSVSRTIIDLARYHGPESCFMAMSWAIREQQLTEADIQAEWKPSLNSKDILDWASNNVDPRVESPAEASFLAQVRWHGAIQVTPQFPIIDAWRRQRRADFLVDGTRLLVEINGIGKYGTTGQQQQQQLKAEKDRLDGLLNAGYHVLNYSAKQVFDGVAYEDLCRRLRVGSGK